MTAAATTSAATAATLAHTPPRRIRVLAGTAPWAGRRRLPTLSLSALFLAPGRENLEASSEPNEGLGQCALADRDSYILGVTGRLTRYSLFRTSGWAAPRWREAPGGRSLARAGCGWWSPRHRAR